jgi:hypothetical protein
VVAAAADKQEGEAAKPDEYGSNHSCERDRDSVRDEQSFSSEVFPGLVFGIAGLDDTAARLPRPALLH